MARRRVLARRMPWPSRATSGRDLGPAGVAQRASPARAVAADRESALLTARVSVRSERESALTEGRLTVTDPQLRPRGATLEEVARLAGVSRATVSRVVNGSPRVSGDLRRSVETAV